MKTPTFTQSEKFLGEYDLPCFVAEMRNSDVPGVGAQYIAETGVDKKFQIYLRVKSLGDLSPWMREKMEQLFERNGLSEAIAEGLRELGRDGFGFLPESERESAKAYGYHPGVYVTKVVIDEVKRKVLISLGDLSVLSEHGITVYLKGDRWRFADAEHFGRYEVTFDKYLPKPDVSKWEKKFPKVPGRQAEKDCSIIYGTWVFSRIESEQLCKELGWEFTQAFLGNYAFSETHVEKDSHREDRYQILGLKRRGNWITIDVLCQLPGFDRLPGYTGTRWKKRFWCDGLRLIEGWDKDVPPRGRVYLKAGCVDSKGSSAVDSP